MRTWMRNADSGPSGMGGQRMIPERGAVAARATNGYWITLVGSGSAKGVDREVERERRVWTM